MHTSRFSHLSTVLIALIGTLALLGAACSTSSDGTSSGVASLEDVAVADVADVVAGDSTLASDEAALQFSQCMRDEGLDFPDIGVDAEGNPNVGEAFQAAGVDPRSEEFREAIQTCGETLQNAGFGGGRRQGLSDNVEVQDALLEFTECLRDEGLDVGDLQLGGDPGAGQGDGQGQGQGQNAAGDGPAPGQGQREGGFGDRGNRIANALGLDPDDPDTAAAMDQCTPILDTAFANFGPDAANNG